MKHTHTQKNYKNALNRNKAKKNLNLLFFISQHEKEWVKERKHEIIQIFSFYFPSDATNR